MKIPPSVRNAVLCHLPIYIAIFGFSIGKIFETRNIGFATFLIIFGAIAIFCLVLMWNNKAWHKPIKSVSDTLWNFWTLAALIGLMYKTLRGETSDFATKLLNFDSLLASIALVGAASAAAAKLAVSVYEVKDAYRERQKDDSQNQPVASVVAAPTQEALAPK